MIERRIGDIFEQKDLDVIAHQANCHHLMGGGIAAVIKKRYPFAYATDLTTVYGSRDKLGTFSLAEIDDEDIYIANLYGQYDIANQFNKSRATKYDALYDALDSLYERVANFTSYRGERPKIGVPCGLGCALGGGSWTVVAAILEDIFEGSHLVDLVICEYQPK